MYLTDTLGKLRAEREELIKAIIALEALQMMASTNDGLRGRVERRGRKSMESKEREEVSRRMKKYWAGWHQKQHHMKAQHAGAFEDCAPCQERLLAYLAEIDQKS